MILRASASACAGCAWAGDARMAAAGEGAVFGVGLAYNRAAGVEHARNDCRVDVGDEAFQYARAVDKRNAGHADRILDADVVALEAAGWRAFDVATPIPGVEWIVLRRRPVAWVARIFHRRTKLGEFLQAPIRSDWPLHAVLVRLSLGVRHLNAEFVGQCADFPDTG